jgi:hypothetical protein
VNCFTITVGRMCDLNILGTRMEASLSLFLEPGYDTLLAEGEGPST